MKKLFLLLSFFLFVLYGEENQSSGCSKELLDQTIDYYAAPASSRSWWDGPYLTGDWKGGRSKLANDGVKVGLSFVTDMLGNPIGGKAKGFAYAGSFGLNIDVDIGKHTALKGLSFFTSAVWRTGTNLSADKIGNHAMCEFF